MIEQIDDRALIQGTLAGRADYFDILIERHLPQVEKHVFRMMRRPTDRDDVMQEVLLKVWKNLNRFRGESSFRTWMTRIAINEVLMSYRRRRANPISGEAADDVRSPAEPVLQSIIRRDRLRRVLTAVKFLPVGYKDVFFLYFIENMTLRETAERLDLTTSAVKSRLFRTRHLLVSHAIRTSEWWTVARSTKRWQPQDDHFIPPNLDDLVDLSAAVYFARIPRGFDERKTRSHTA